MLNIYSEIIDRDVPVQLGLDLMQAHKLVLDFNEDVIKSGIFQLALPIEYQNVHAVTTIHPIVYFYAKL